MILTCHQPNFFPWVPFFEKMEQSDAIVLLENVQFTRHQFQNRFYYEDRWHTMPVNHGKLNDKIKNKIYINHEKNWERIKNKFPKLNLKIFDDDFSSSLSQTNKNIISRISEMLLINKPIYCDYEDSDTLKPTDYLIKICKSHNATTYLSGPSGIKYLEVLKFERAGIELKYFDAKEKIPSFQLLRKYGKI
jgi:hypothetical protein